MRSRLIPNRRHSAVRALAWTAAAAAAFTAAMGFLHTPAGRPLMRRLGMRCPARSVSPEVAEALRQRGLRGLRGLTPAPARPALGLQLDGAHLPAVQSWAEARGGLCTARARPSALLTCGHMGAYDEATFGFAPDGRLVSVSTLRARLPGRGAAGSFQELRQVLSTQLGEGALAGDATAAALEGGPLHTARLQYRFSDYLATVTAMNLPAGVALREQYESARD